SHFMISFDGNALVHDEVRGKGNFEKAIKTAQKIIEYKKLNKTKYPLIVAKITFTENNHHDLDSLIDYLINHIGFNGITLNLLFDNNARDGFVDGQSLNDKKFWSGNEISFSSEKISSM